MACVVCLKTNSSVKDPSDDCVFKYLEKIRAHYIHIKSQLDDKHYEIEKLQGANEDLRKNLASLKSSPKRRKTNSLEDTPLSLSNELGAGDASLNDAIKGTPTWDDDSSFFVATQRTTTPRNVLKPLSQTPRRSTPVSASSSPSSIPRLSGGSSILPRRIRGTPLSGRQKYSSTTSPGNLENKEPRWISKENFKSSDTMLDLIKRDWNESCRKQSPQQRKEPSFQLDSSSGERKKLLPLRNEANFRQTRLKFETPRVEDVKDEPETIVPETDETFCTDLIEASPKTRLPSTAYETAKSKPRGARKLNRYRLLTTCETVKKAQIPQLNIKIEPQPTTVKKIINFDLKPSASPTITSSIPFAKDREEGGAKEGGSREGNSLEKEPKNNSTLSGIERNSDVSVCILPSQPNDVILVDESNGDMDVNIDSAALFDELLLSNETSDFLRKIEAKCISNIKNQQDKQNKIAKTVVSGEVSPDIIPKHGQNRGEVFAKIKNETTVPDKSILGTTISSSPNEKVNPSDRRIEANSNESKIIPVKWNCKECEAYYGIAGRTMHDKELQKRMKYCVDNHKLTTYQTPEGFWDPCFPPTPEVEQMNLRQSKD